MRWQRATPTPFAVTRPLSVLKFMHGLTHLINCGETFTISGATWKGPTPRSFLFGNAKLEMRKLGFQTRYSTHKAWIHGQWLFFQKQQRGTKPCKSIFLYYALFLALAFSEWKHVASMRMRQIFLFVLVCWDPPGFFFVKRMPLRLTSHFRRWARYNLKNV